jgi:hypothetical protein
MFILRTPFKQIKEPENIHKSMSHALFAPTFLADLHVSNVGGERPEHPVGAVVWSRPSCHDRPTNFLVLPTFAEFSAHSILHSSLHCNNCSKACMDRLKLTLAADRSAHYDDMPVHHDMPCV